MAPKRGRPRLLSPENEAALATSFLAGASQAVLGRRYGRPVASIRNILARLGVKRERGRPTALPLVDQLELVARYIAGESPTALAEDYGIHVNTVLYTARKHGAGRGRRQRKEVADGGQASN